MIGLVRGLSDAQLMGLYGGDAPSQLDRSDFVVLLYLRDSSYLQFVQAQATYILETI